jgi:hypothetical protein
MAHRYHYTCRIFHAHGCSRVCAAKDSNWEKCSPWHKRFVRGLDIFGVRRCCVGNLCLPRGELTSLISTHYWDGRVTYLGRLVCLSCRSRWQDRNTVIQRHVSYTQRTRDRKQMYHGIMVVGVTTVVQPLRILLPSANLRRINRSVEYYY